MRNSLSKNCLLWLPAVIQALAQRATVDAGNSGPFSEAHGFAFKGDKPIPASIACLLWSCRPATVVRAIPALVVDAFDCHLIRALAHVGKKSFIRISPFRANGDASAAIVLPARRLSVLAASLHGLPNTVGPGQVLMMGSVRATAAYGSAAFKMV